MTPQTYVGIDLHKTTLTIGARNSIGELVNTIPFPTKCVDKITHFFSHLPSPVHCAIESVGMYEWLWDHLEPRVDKLVLADAVELRYRAGKRHAKTDKTDAKFISLLLSSHIQMSHNMLPLAKILTTSYFGLKLAYNFA